MFFADLDNVPCRLGQSFRQSICSNVFIRASRHYKNVNKLNKWPKLSSVALECLIAIAWSTMWRITTVMCLTVRHIPAYCFAGSTNSKCVFVTRDCVACLEKATQMFIRQQDLDKSPKNQNHLQWISPSTFAFAECNNMQGSYWHSALHCNGRPVHVILTSIISCIKL